MTLQQLEYLVAVAKYKHFVKAAEVCGITQPTLSMTIQKLEEELNVQIFERSKHPIEITATGQKIINQAQTAINEFHRLKEIVSVETNMLPSNLRLAIIPTIAPYLIPDFILLFRKEYPEITLSIYELRTSLIVEQLLSASIDLAILATPLKHDDLLEVPLYYEKFVTYFSADNPFKDKPIEQTNMPIDDLWVLQEGHCVRNQVFNFCGKSDIKEHVYEAGSIDTLVKIIDKNKGYTLIPELHIPFLNQKQVKNIRQIENPPAIREVSIVIRKDFIKEKTINIIADVVKQIIPAHMLDKRLKKFSIKL